MSTATALPSDPAVQTFGSAAACSQQKTNVFSPISLFGICSVVSVSPFLNVYRPCIWHGTHSCVPVPPIASRCRGPLSSGFSYPPPPAQYLIFAFVLYPSTPPVGPLNATMQPLQLRCNYSTVRGARPALLATIAPVPPIGWSCQPPFRVLPTPRPPPQFPAPPHYYSPLPNAECVIPPYVTHRCL
eukprot:EG_transcript_29990